MADDLTRDLLDDEGENLAVRSFLMQYSCDRSVTVGAMLAHMNDSGWRGTAPAFALGCRPETHLTKAGAQIWMRHLFSLEAPPSSPVADDGLPPLPAGDEAGMYSGSCIVYAADQVRQAQRDAYAAGRAAGDA